MPAFRPPPVKTAIPTAAPKDLFHLHAAVVMVILQRLLHIAVPPTRTPPTAVSAITLILQYTEMV
jgi:hypothetical protein